MAIDSAKAILAFNHGREPERLRMKYANMRGSAFAFLRGTCHLFYARLPAHALLDTAPPAWSCGDLHLENFGSYRGEDHLAYFDINDFDEAALAPLTWDVLRFLSSVLVGAGDMRLVPEDATRLCSAFLDGYRATLASGTSIELSRADAHGLLRELLDAAAQRTRADFLAHRTSGSGAHRRILLRENKTLAALPGERERVAAILERFARTQDDPAFYQVTDVARRIAGTGSLGVERDVVLVRGKGGDDGHYLLDLKRALPSSLPTRPGMPQPRWHNEAERIVALQCRMQAVHVGRLHALAVADTSYVLRALLPSEDRVTLRRDVQAFGRIADVVRSMGDIVASAQLRSAGRDGAATVAELTAFARGYRWPASMVDLATQCAQGVEDDWQAYCRAYDAGMFDIA
jgi:uncharacterized protein (DUF2252 family)